MACQCTRCPECSGSGTVWFAFGGKYLGKHRSDDLDEMGPCEECGGSGVTEVCWECSEAIRDDCDL